MSDVWFIEELRSIHEKYTACGYGCCAVCKECGYTTWPCRTELLIREVEDE